MLIVHYTNMLVWYGIGYQSKAVESCSLKNVSELSQKLLRARIHEDYISSPTPENRCRIDQAAPRSSKGLGGSHWALAKP